MIGSATLNGGHSPHLSHWRQNAERVALCVQIIIGSRAGHVAAWWSWGRMGDTMGWYACGRKPGKVVHVSGNVGALPECDVMSPNHAAVL